MTKASVKEKISYGFCAVSYETEMNIVLSYFMLFCTDVMHIAPEKIGIVFLVTKVIDAMTDVLITSIADKTQTKYGTYRPWILLGIPLAIAFVLCFWNPGFLQNETQQLIWIVVMYILSVPICETGLMCCAMVMGTIMSQNREDRLQFALARNLGENAGDIISNLLCMGIILSFGSYKEITGWRVMAVTFAVIIAVSSLIGFTGTRERVPVSNKDIDGTQLTLLKKLKLLTKDAAYIKLLIIHCSFIFEWLVTLVLFNYFCIYNLGHEEWMMPLSVIGVVVELGTTSALTYFSKKIKKRKLIFVGCGLLFASGLVLWLCQSFFTAVIYQILRGIGDGIMFGIVWSMWPDASDHLQKKTGIMAPGIVLAFGSFMIKVFNALSNYVASVILDVGGYDAFLTTQSDFTLNMIRYGMVICILIPITFAWISNRYLTEFRDI